MKTYQIPEAGTAKASPSIPLTIQQFSGGKWSEQTQFIIDTGSEISQINRNLADFLGFVKKGSIPSRIANGDVNNMPTAQFNIAIIGTAETMIFSGVTVVISDGENLLGMDIVRFFDLRILKDKIILSPNEEELLKLKRTK